MRNPIVFACHALLLATGLALAATSASAISLPKNNGLDPSDRVQGYFGLDRFARLEAGRLYDLNIAIRRGRVIYIAGCTASESREVISLAVSDHAAAIALAQRLCR